MSVFHHQQINKKLLTTPFTDPILIPGPIDLGILQSLRTIALSFTIATADNVIFPMCSNPTREHRNPTQLDRLHPGK
jgi:hypothetical protein